MARVILPDFVYQPDDISALNWDEAPPAPAHYQSVVEWNDKRWNKSYCGLVWAPQIRDELFDIFENFGTFRTPVLLDQEGYRKFCYLVVGDADLRDYADGKYDRQSLVTTTLPKNYLPFEYRHIPLAWVRNQFFIRKGAQTMVWNIDHRVKYFLRALHDVNSKRSHKIEDLLEDDLFMDAAGQLVKTNDQVRLVKCSETELNGTIGTVYYHEPFDEPSMVRVYVPSMRGGISLKLPIHNLIKLIPTGTDIALVPPKSPKHVVDWSKMAPERKRKRQTRQEVRNNAVGLCDLSTDVKQHIASFLPLLDVELHLRHACRDTFWNFRKPPPDNLEYDFVYFKVSIVDNGEDLYSNQWHGMAHTTDDVLVAIRNHDWMMEEITITLKFVKFDRNQANVPLFRWECEYPHYHPAFFDALGCHYCGVKQASHVELDSCTISLHRDENPEETEDKGHFAVFRYCRDWTPREPRIQLRHIGVRLMEFGDCSLFYSPEWFENSSDFAFSAPLDSHDKSVILLLEHRPHEEDDFSEGEDFYEDEDFDRDEEDF